MDCHDRERASTDRPATAGTVRAVVLAVLAGAVLVAIYLLSPSPVRRGLPVLVSGAAALMALRVTRLQPRPLVGLWFALAATMAGFTAFWVLLIINAPAPLRMVVLLGSYLCVRRTRPGWWLHAAVAGAGPRLSTSR